MDSPLRCPDESYDISRFICRGRQAKGYEKCPSCPNRAGIAPEESVPSGARPAMAVIEATSLGNYGNELEFQEPPPSALGGMAVSARRLVETQHAAITVVGATGAALMGKGHGVWAFARRLYDYF